MRLLAVPGAIRIPRSKTRSSLREAWSVRHGVGLKGGLEAIARVLYGASSIKYENSMVGTRKLACNLAIRC